MHWFRLPLFIWAHYATALIQVLGTPVIAITLVLMMLERALHWESLIRTLAVTRYCFSIFSGSTRIPLYTL
jgi:heme/copper-type cytochrome/quinol oxidase subunit 1